MATIPTGLSMFVFAGSLPITLSSATWKSNVNSIYEVNASKTGYLNYKPASEFPTVTQLVKDKFYLIDCITSFDLPGAQYAAGVTDGGTTQPGAKILYYLHGDSFAYGAGSEGTSPSSAYYGGGGIRGPYIVGKQVAAILKLNDQNVQIDMVSEGYPGQTGSWYANNENNNGQLAKAIAFITANKDNYDKIYYCGLFGTNDEAQPNVNGTTSVQKLINDMNAVHTQIKSISSNIYVIGYPVTNRTDVNAQPGTPAFQSAYNSQIYSSPSLINADVVGDYTSYPEVYATNAPNNNTYFNVTPPDNDNLSGVHPRGKGYYRLAMMMAKAVATHAGLTIKPDGYPLILLQPEPHSVTAGQPIDLTAGVMGDGLTYKWRKGGVVITGQIAAAFHKDVSTTDDSGSYDCVVTGSKGTVTSTTVIVTIANAAINLSPTLPSSGMDYLAVFTGESPGINEIATQGNFGTYDGYGIPALSATIGTKNRKAFTFNKSVPDAFKLTLTNCNERLMVACVARINNRDSGKAAAILSLPFNQCTFGLANNYSDGRLISTNQNREIGGEGVNAGLPTGQLAAIVFYSVGTALKVRLGGQIFTESGGGGFLTLQSALNDFLVGGNTDTGYPNRFDGALGALVIANGPHTDDQAAAVETALKNYYGI